MAVNSVPLGQAGTGAAYILGEDAASQNFNRNLQNYQLQQQKKKQLEQQNAMAIADSYRKNMLAASDGKLFSKQLSDLEQKHIKQGMDYMSQGFDIYRPNPNDPKQVQAAEQYMSDRRTIENLRNYRQGIETKFKEINKAISKANVGEYNQSDIDKMHEFINGTDILDAYRSGADLPEVRKNFNEREALKGVKALSDLDKRVVGENMVETTKINVPKTEQAIINSIQSSQGGNEYLQQVTKGVPINFLKQLPNSYEEIKKRVQDDLNGSSKDEKAQLAELGIVKGTKRYDDYVEQSARDFYEAKRGYVGLIDRGLGIASSGFKSQEKVTPLMTPFQKASLEERRLNRQRLERQGKSGSEDEILYRNNLIDRVFAGAKGSGAGIGSGEEIGALLEGRGFDREWKFPEDKNDPNSGKTVRGKSFAVTNYVDKDGKKTGRIKITVAPRTVMSTSVDEDGVETEKAKKMPARSIIIDANKDEDRSKINAFINEVTGEKISESKLRTNQASGKTSATVSGKTNSQPKSYKTKYGTFSEEQLKAQYGDAWQAALKKIQ